MTNRFASRKKLTEKTKVVDLDNLQETEIAAEKTPKTAAKKRDGRKSIFETTPRTYSLITQVIEEADKTYRIGQIEGTISKKIAFGTFLSECIHEALHNGEKLVDLESGEALK